MTDGMVALMVPKVNFYWVQQVILS